MHWIDPEQLAVTRGEVERFLINPHGEVDGVLLAGGCEVHIPPHLGKKLRANLDVGAPLAVRGLKPRGCDMVCAVSFGGRDGLAVLDEGPPERHGKHHGRAHHDAGEPMSVDGTITRFLHGAKGEVRGALLDNGVQLRWKKHEADQLAALRVGDWLVAEGDARTLDELVLIEVAQIAS